MQEHLDLDECDMFADSFDAVSDAVAKWPHLTSLHLRAPGSCPDRTFLSCTKLETSLKVISSLQHFSVGGRHFGGRVSALLPVLATHHTALVHLDLGAWQNHAEEVTTMESCEVLSTLTRLTSLQIPKHFCYEAPVLPQAEFAASLPALSCLQELDLSDSNMCLAAEVVQALSTLTSLTMLKLADAGINAYILPVLAAALRCLRALRYLHVHGEGNCYPLADALSTLTSLQSASVQCDVFVYGQGRAFVKALEHLPHLTLLDLGVAVTPEEWRDCHMSEFYQARATWLIIAPDESFLFL